MIKAGHHPLVVGFFRLYTMFKIRSVFRDVVISADAISTRNSVLLISNHMSWWDGFWAFYLNIKVMKKRFFFMMDYTELKKRMIFSKAGGFSIEKSTKSVLESIAYTRNLLQDSQNLVVIYPQGKLYSNHSTTIQFQKGIDNILENTPAEIIFLVQLVEYFQYPKPTVYLYTKQISSAQLQGEKVETFYQEFYNECLTKHQSITV